MKIVAIIFTIISMALWAICAKGWSGDKVGYLLAYFLKYPAILFTVMSLILFMIIAFTK